MNKNKKRRIVSIALVLLLILSFGTTGVMAKKGGNSHSKGSSRKQTETVSEPADTKDYAEDEDEEVEEDRGDNIEDEDELDVDQEDIEDDSEEDGDEEDEDENEDDENENEKKELKHIRKELKKEEKAVQFRLKQVRKQIREEVKSLYKQGDLEALSELKEDLEAKYKGIKVLPVDCIISNGYQFKFDTPPVIKEGRTLIPARAITGGLGAEVEWNDEERTVTIIKGDTIIKLRIDDRIAVVNGEEIQMDTQAKIMNNRTIVPLRFIAETLNIKVGWYEEDETISLEDEDTEDQTTDETEGNENETSSDDTGDETNTDNSADGTEDETAAADTAADNTTIDTAEDTTDNTADSTTEDTISEDKDTTTDENTEADTTNEDAVTIS